MIKLNAYAKINFVLKVLDKRSDNYHEVVMVMQSISLADIITVKRSSKKGINVQSNMNITKDQKDNLGYQAAALFLEKYCIDKTLGIDIFIEKNIPIAAGLAGGSTDCAAILHGLNKLLDLNLTLDKLQAIANQLGSDIAFCLEGGTKLAKGRGECIFPLPFIGKMSGLILMPPFSLSTKEVYRNLDIHNRELNENLEIIENYKQGEVHFGNLQNMLANDLLESAIELSHEIPKFLEKIRGTNPAGYQLSGSGPAIFCFYKNSEERKSAAAKLQEFILYNFETIETGYKWIKT
ncbi:4-(cytidine 5'-diphospho)-2-C-methyl-D-erythritol kinase [bacterium]|nr:4-(cytidine 5'-diphospho)-2-C-methyl-D-erythritol kinase [bacterium]